MATQPTKLEQSYREICAKHDIHSVSIGLLLPNDGRGSGWSVSLQRWQDGAVVGCWMANGQSIQAAVGNAIAQIYAVDEPLLADEPIAEAA